MTLEICCFNISSCRFAQDNGAGRIELCDNPAEGGTTPSAGLVEAARKILAIDLYPIIRPRGGDFLYDDDDFGIMRRDVLMCKELGCDGVVIGMVDRSGAIDVRRMAQLVTLAYPMEVTCHRAFDQTSDPFEALETIISIGCTRILTSGQRPTAREGIALIAELVSISGERIVIMPGSGVRSENIRSLIEGTGAAEFHSTARMKHPTGMDFVNDAMKEKLYYDVCDGEEVRRMKAVINEQG